jgi:hypothetical protein
MLEERPQPSNGEKWTIFSWPPGMEGNTWYCCNHSGKRFDAQKIIERDNLRKAQISLRDLTL